MENIQLVKLEGVEFNKLGLCELMEKLQSQYGSKVYSVELYDKNSEDKLSSYFFSVDEFSKKIEDSTLDGIDILTFEMIDEQGRDITLSVAKNNDVGKLSELGFNVFSNNNFTDRNPCDYYKLENGVVAKYNRVTKLYYSLDKEFNWVENGSVLSWIIGSEYDYCEIKGQVK